MIHILRFQQFSPVNESIRVDKIDPSFYERETVASLPYSKYISENRNPFLKKLINISKDLGIKPIWLLHTIFHESKFDSKKVDRYTGAIGLFSFFPEVVKDFLDQQTGKTITPNDILNMSNVDQLDLIHSFYQTWIENLGIEKPLSPGDFAALTFYPSLIKKDWDWEFPEYIVDKNKTMFNNFSAQGGKTKKDYYDYMEGILGNEDEYTDSDQSILGDFGGVFVSPSMQQNKKPLEYYKDLVSSKDDPSTNANIQQQDTETTETHKQKG